MVSCSQEEEENTRVLLKIKTARRQRDIANFIDKDASSDRIETIKEFKISAKVPFVPESD